MNKQNCSLAPSFGGFPGLPSWEETAQKTQNLPVGIYIFSGPGASWAFPGGPGTFCLGERL